MEVLFTQSRFQFLITFKFVIIFSSEKNSLVKIPACIEDMKR